MARIGIPGADEYAQWYAGYIAALPPGDVIETLAAQGAEVQRLLGVVGESPGEHRYAEGKWTVKEVLGHLADGERVFAYRALWFAREDAAALPGFDENAWVPAGRFGARSLADLAAELAVVRAATLALFRGLDDAALARRGVANGHPVSVRALAAIIAGHERHHLALLRERYGLRG